MMPSTALLLFGLNGGKSRRLHPLSKKDRTISNVWSCVIILKPFWSNMLFTVAAGFLYYWFWFFPSKLYFTLCKLCKKAKEDSLEFCGICVHRFTLFISLCSFIVSPYEFTKRLQTHLGFHQSWMGLSNLQSWKWQ